MEEKDATRQEQGMYCVCVSTTYFLLPFSFSKAIYLY